MRDFNIYLCGGMGKFGKDNFDEGNAWREYITEVLEGCVAPKYRVYCCNPNHYYNFLDDSTYDSESEIMNFDIRKVKQSDLIIVYFNDPNSIGSACELAIAHDNDIPIIGLKEPDVELHPWLTEMTDKMFTDMDELLTYIKEFYLF